MAVKTSGKEYFYAVSGLMAPKYMVSDTLTSEIEGLVEWVQKYAERMRAFSGHSVKTFVNELEKLYPVLCSVHARWLEVEAARMLRMADLEELEMVKKLAPAFITNLQTLAVDIQMAQSNDADANAFETGYADRNEIENCKDVISGMKIVKRLLENSDFDKAFESATSIDGLRDSFLGLPLFTSITSKNKELAMMLIDDILNKYSNEIDFIFANSVSTGDMKMLLIVDDMPEILTALSLMLKDHFRIIPFTGGADALDFIDSTEQPDAFLLDIDMPDMDGLTLAENIRKRTIYANTPILFLTGDSSKEAVLKSRQYNAKAFIIKPANKDIIISKLNSCLK